jgi:predicted rRNA methylase YqxC with S4 and FtsJ domains
MREMRYSDVSLNHAVQALPLIVAAANKDMSYAQLMKSQFKVQPVQLKRLHKFAEHSASEDCMPSRVRIWLRKIKEDLPL